MRINENRLRRIISESLYDVIFEDEKSINADSDNVGSAMNGGSADNDGTTSYSTSVSSLKDDGDSQDMVITGKSGAECQSKLKQSQNQNPSFYNNPANKVHFKINPSGKFNF